MVWSRTPVTALRSAASWEGSRNLGFGLGVRRGLVSTSGS